MRRLPGPADCRLSEGVHGSRGSLRIVLGLAENTNSIFCDGSHEPETANGCPVLRRAGATRREAYTRRMNPEAASCAVSRPRPIHLRLPLTTDLHGSRRPNVLKTAVSPAFGLGGQGNLQPNRSLNHLSNSQKMIKKRISPDGFVSNAVSHCGIVHM